LFFSPLNDVPANAQIYRSDGKKLQYEFRRFSTKSQPTEDSVAVFAWEGDGQEPTHWIVALQTQSQTNLPNYEAKEFPLDGKDRSGLNRY
jgi:hypothetical protein